MSDAVQRKGLMHLGGGGKTFTWGALCIECPAGKIAGLSPAAPQPLTPFSSICRGWLSHA